MALQVTLDEREVIEAVKQYVSMSFGIEPKRLSVVLAPGSAVATVIAGPMKPQGTPVYRGEQNG